MLFCFGISPGSSHTTVVARRDRDESPRTRSDGRSTPRMSRSSVWTPRHTTRIWPPPGCDEPPPLEEALKFDPPRKTNKWSFKPSLNGPYHEPPPPPVRKKYASSCDQTRLLEASHGACVRADARSMYVCLRTGRCQSQLLRSRTMS